MEGTLPKSDVMWEIDVEWASAGGWIPSMRAHVWVGGARKGDICGANVARAETSPYVPWCVQLNSHLLQTSECKMIIFLAKWDNVL